MLLARLPADETTVDPQPLASRVPWRGGWAAMPHAATRSALPNNAYRVLGLLIGHMDLTTCEVHGQSAQRLARELAWSTRTVERALATLRATGWVSAYPDPAPYRMGWLVYVVRQEDAGNPPSIVSDPHRQEWRNGSDSPGGTRPTNVSIHDQDSDSDSDQKESTTVVAAAYIASEVTVTPSHRSQRRQERRTPTDTADAPPPAVVSEPTATEQLLLDTGFHPNTARAFSGLDCRAVRGELHKQDLLGWLPREDRDRRIGMLVLRWRRAEPEADGGTQQAESSKQQAEGSKQQAEGSTQETRDTRHDTEGGPDHQPPTIDHQPPTTDPWTERAQRLRPAWTSAQHTALAQALRHAPNDGAAVVMAQVALGVALRR